MVDFTFPVRPSDDHIVNWDSDPVELSIVSNSQWITAFYDEDTYEPVATNK